MTMRLQWFGESWGAPICDPADHADTPTGQACARCEKPIEPGAQGLLVLHVGDIKPPERLPWHLDCWLESLGIKYNAEQAAEALNRFGAEAEPGEQFGEWLARNSVIHWPGCKCGRCRS